MYCVYDAHRFKTTMLTRAGKITKCGILILDYNASAGSQCWPSLEWRFVGPMMMAHFYMYTGFHRSTMYLGFLGILGTGPIKKRLEPPFPSGLEKWSGRTSLGLPMLKNVSTYTVRTYPYLQH